MSSIKEKFNQISPSEFFYSNRDLAGFSNPTRSLYTAVREFVENALDACDDLADDMEFVIDGINHTATAASKEVVDCKVMSVETDQGLFEPFGIAMVDIEIIYQQDENT